MNDFAFNNTPMYAINIRKIKQRLSMKQSAVFLIYYSFISYPSAVS